MNAYQYFFGQTFQALTQTCSAREKGFVEVFIVDRDGLHQCRAHAHHGLPILSPANNKHIFNELNYEHAKHIHSKFRRIARRVLFLSSPAAPGLHSVTHMNHPPFLCDWVEYQVFASVLPPRIFMPSIFY